MVGKAESGEDVAFDGAAAPPVVGVAATAVGYTLITVEPDLRRVMVMEGLTAESAAARLAGGGLAPPLYRHASLDVGHAARGAAARGVTGASARLRMEVTNILQAATGNGATAQQRYDGDPVRDLLDVVRREYGLPPATPFQAVGVDGGPVGPARRRSPRHRLPFDLMSKGPKCVG